MRVEQRRGNTAVVSVPTAGLAGDDVSPKLQEWSQRLQQAADPFPDAVVVVVDDNSANILLLERLLHGAGIVDVHAIDDSREAVRRCVELRPDLILLDLHMPNVDGFGVLAALQNALPDEPFLPVIVLTADATPATRERALDAGAKDFLAKPFDRVEVLQRARNVIRTRSLYDGIRQEHDRLQIELDRHLLAERQREAECVRKRSAIASVLGAGGPRMVFQPICDMSTNQTVGVEALARFDVEPRRTPDRWFEDAAAVGLGAELETAAASGALHQLGDLGTGKFLSVNASPATLADPAFREAIRNSDPNRLVVELTEHERVADYPALVAATNDLRSMGVRVAVDDAGAGYAGLQRILHLRPDIIKLDMDLTRDIHLDPVRRALAAALVAFADDTGARIVAEGIENGAERTVLQQLGVQWGQGYHLAGPGPLADCH